METQGSVCTKSPTYTGLLFTDLIFGYSNASICFEEGIQQRCHRNVLRVPVTILSRQATHHWTGRNVHEQTQ